MEKLLEVYNGVYIGSSSASLVIVNPKVPQDDQEEGSTPYTVQDVQILGVEDQEEELEDTVPVVAEIDVSGLSSIILCAVIVICCFVSVLRD